MAQVSIGRTYPTSFRNLHPILHFPHELVSYIQVSKKVKTCGLVMEVGTSLAFVKQLKCFDRFNIESFGQLHRDGANAVAHDDLLYDRRLDGVFRLLLFHRKSVFLVLPIVQTFYQNSREIISALSMKRFVVKQYKTFYQPHALHPLIDFFVGSVQRSGGGLNTSSHKGHNYLCP